MPAQYYIRLVIIAVIIEFVLLILACVGMAVINPIVERQRKIFKDKVREISDIIVGALGKSQEFSEEIFPSRLRVPQAILTAIEDFDIKLKDPQWEKFKGDIAHAFLMPKAREWAHSFNWRRRNFAVRCFAHMPLKEDETRLMRLLQDHIPINRVFACEAAIMIGTESLLKAFFRQMSIESERSLYAFRDALLNGRHEVYEWLKQQLRTEKDPNLRYVYLDVFAERAGYDILDAIQIDLNSPSREMRLKSVRILLRFPSDKTLPQIMSFLSDPYEMIRAETARGIGLILGVEAIPYLKDLLNDSAWWVKMQAALALKELKERGKRVLESVPIEEKETRQVADYVLSLPAQYINLQ